MCAAHCSDAVVPSDRLATRTEDHRHHCAVSAQEDAASARIDKPLVNGLGPPVGHTGRRAAFSWIICRFLIHQLPSAVPLGDRAAELDSPGAAPQTACVAASASQHSSTYPPPLQVIRFRGWRRPYANNKATMALTRWLSAGPLLSVVKHSTSARWQLRYTYPREASDSACLTVSQATGPREPMTDHSARSLNRVQGGTNRAHFPRPRLE